MLKWQGVKTKIDPVMDDLLIFYKKDNVNAELLLAPKTGANTAINQSSLPDSSKPVPKSIHFQQNDPRPPLAQNTTHKLSGTMAYDAEGVAMKLGCLGEGGGRPASNLLAMAQNMERHQISCVQGGLYVQCENGHCAKE